VDDGLQVQFLSSEARESILEIKTHLMTKHADGACTGAVALLYALRHDTVEQV
jgi:hypothetical protein